MIWLDEEIKVESEVEDAIIYTDRRAKVRASICSGDHVTAISVPRWHIHDKDKKVCYYEVQVSNESMKWNVFKRFSEFRKLHVKLREMYKRLKQRDIELPELPPFPVRLPKPVVNHLDSGFLEERRAVLDTYMCLLVSDDALDWTVCDEVVSFLAPNDSDAFVPKGLAAALGLEPKQEEGDSFRRELERDSPSSIEGEVKGSRTFEDVDVEVTDARIGAVESLPSGKLLYIVQVWNSQKRSSFSEWTILKSFQDFFEFDVELRKELSSKVPLGTKSATMQALEQIQPLQEKKNLKSLVNLKHSDFLETRKVLLQHYLDRVIQIPELHQLAVFHKFFNI